jgi:hypothetical protein
MLQATEIQALVVKRNLLVASMLFLDNKPNDKWAAKTASELIDKELSKSLKINMDGLRGDSEFREEILSLIEKADEGLAELDFHWSTCECDKCSAEA